MPSPSGRGAASRARAVHVMKGSTHAGWVLYASVAFAGSAAELRDAFWEDFRRRLNPHMVRYGSVNRRVRSFDWMVVCKFSWPEQLIDRLLRETAEAVDVLIYIDPAISLSEMTTDPSAFLHMINIAQRRRDN